MPLAFPILVNVTFSCSSWKPQSRHYISLLPHTPHLINCPILLILWLQCVWHLTPPVCCPSFLLPGFCHDLGIYLPSSFWQHPFPITYLHYQHIFSSYILYDFIYLLKWWATAIIPSLKCRDFKVQQIMVVAWFTEK